MSKCSSLLSIFTERNMNGWSIRRALLPFKEFFLTHDKVNEIEQSTGNPQSGQLCCLKHFTDPSELITTYCVREFSLFYGERKIFSCFYFTRQPEHLQQLHGKVIKTKWKAGKFIFVVSRIQQSFYENFSRCVSWIRRRKINGKREKESFSQAETRLFVSEIFIPPKTRKS